MQADAVAPIFLDADAALPPSAGGKARNLLILSKNGFAVPPTLFLPATCYEFFIRSGDLLPAIEALADDSVDALRWEEIWDASLALRNRFLRRPMSAEIAEPLLAAVENRFGDAPLAVRSCSSQEDSGFSHAGMHDSILDVNRDGLLRAVRQVWASLWSDRAVLYRREMGLAPDRSTMGVLIQPMMYGDVSGVMFTRSPTDERSLVMECAHGTASGVVDDSAETERILLRRGDGRPVDRLPGIVSPELAEELFRLGMQAESLLGGPQDMEWTAGEDVVVLQSRPVTTLAGSGDAEGWKEADQRPWLLNLTRSHDNLLTLAERIQTDILPDMKREAEAMKKADLAALSCDEVAVELDRRRQRLEFWRDVYWRELIPFAHAVRQFGMLYNDAVAPQDPFEFTSLLTGQNLLAVRRNELLDRMTALAAQDRELRDALADRRLPESGPYVEALAEFMDRFGDLACSDSWCEEGPWGVIRFTLEDGGRSTRPRPAPLAADLEARFFEAVEPSRRDFARSVLGLARTSYRLRDDDNIHLGRLQARVSDVRKRAVECGLPVADANEPRAATPSGLAWKPDGEDSDDARRVVGWAAAAGIARGPARVIHGPDDLFDVRNGEVMVCDALDPNMTFVVPLLSAIVERRGGMLVHGAIIAREYGMPCVTGVPDATRRFQTGESLTVDGFRGVVERVEDLDSSVGSRNVLGGPLAPCGGRPMTGFFRTGSCDADAQDLGSHVVCAEVTDAFLRFSRSMGNDLVTPAPEMGFPGLTPGDRWCLCVLRWEEARQAGCAPPVVLKSTHEGALRHVSLDRLTAHALDDEPSN